MHDTNDTKRVATGDQSTRLGAQDLNRETLPRGDASAKGGGSGAARCLPNEVPDDTGLGAGRYGAAAADGFAKFDDLLVSSKQVRARIGGITTMCLWRWRRDGKFPDPIRINGRNYWWDREVRGWIAAQSVNSPCDPAAPDVAPS